MDLGSVVGAVLVGGRSRRMGRDKALLEVDGVAMAVRVGAALRSAGCQRVVAIGPGHLAAGLEPIADEHPGEGPLGGILTALAAATPRPALVVACDLPWMDAATASALCAVGDDLVEGTPAHVVMAFVDRREPLCALWMPSATPVLRAVFDSGERAVHRAVRGLTVVEVPVDPACLINVNTPDDLPE